MSSLIPEDLTQAGAHALVIGVSNYPYIKGGDDPSDEGIEFGIEQLSSAARSASVFAQWLLKEYQSDRAPLRSLRVLLSPSPGEQINKEIVNLLSGDFSATRAHVETALGEVIRAAKSHPENVLIVYAAGHGVQLTKNGAVVLLEDFAKPGQLTRLAGAIDMAGVHDGMNYPGTAQTQFWFVDACRQKPRIAKRFEELTGALTLDTPVGTVETSPLFLAAATGEAAFARVNGVTLFNEGLMWVLKGGGAAGPERNGVPKWHVPVTELIKTLPDRVKELATTAGVEQSVEISGKIHEAVFHEFSSPPSVDLTIDLLPGAAARISKGTLKFNGRDVIFENFIDWPFQKPVGAGLYQLSIQTTPPYLDKTELLQFKRPQEMAEIRVDV
jgi:hypothetical protein